MFFMLNDNNNNDSGCVSYKVYVHMEDDNIIGSFQWYASIAVFMRPHLYNDICIFFIHSPSSSDHSTLLLTGTSKHCPTLHDSDTIHIFPSLVLQGTQKR